MIRTIASVLLCLTAAAVVAIADMPSTNASSASSVTMAYGYINWQRVVR
jgi:hypothetical protein